MERPPLEYAYRLLDKQTRDGLGGMVGVTGMGIHKVVYKNEGDLEPLKWPLMIWIAGWNEG